MLALLFAVAVAVRVTPRKESAEAVCQPTRPVAFAGHPIAQKEDAAETDKAETDRPEPDKVEADKAETPEDDGNVEDGEERLVDGFYAETDKWTAADGDGAKPPAVEDAVAFAEKFRALPDERKEECLQRALNLVPDENVVVLVGILMDKTQERKYIQLVFDDILNRPDDVKMPILERILSDEKHPCNADAKWIFDVTGKRPHGF